jgi:hypothetical protein
MPSNALGGSRNLGTPPSKKDARRRLRPFPSPRQPFGRAMEGRVMAERVAKDNRPRRGIRSGRKGTVGGGGLARRQDHDHLPPFKTGVLFDLGEFGRIVAHAIQQFGP